MVWGEKNAFALLIHPFILSSTSHLVIATQYQGGKDRPNLCPYETRNLAKKTFIKYICTSALIFIMKYKVFGVYVKI